MSEPADVIVVGAGLAGLYAARRLAMAGADVVVLEARGRAGGRIEQAELEDGRKVEVGAEMIGAEHIGMKALAAELGVTLEASYVGNSGVPTWGLREGTSIGPDPEFMTDHDRSSAAAVESQISELARDVDPHNPLSHPAADKLDRTSLAEFLRSRASPNVLRRSALFHRAMGTDPPHRQSMLGVLWKRAVIRTESTEAYDLNAWEGLRAVEGASELTRRLAVNLQPHIRYRSTVTAITIDGPRCRAYVEDGQAYEGAALICTVPVGVLRRITFAGLEQARLQRLLSVRHNLASKIVAAFDDEVWSPSGQNGYSECEDLIGGTWSQCDSVLSGLVPPEDYAYALAAPAGKWQEEVTVALTGLFGAEARPCVTIRRDWGTDPYTLGHTTSWAPGDLSRRGPVEKLHQPPIFFAGSDYWACAYMEGAVQTASDVVGRITSVSTSDGRSN